MAARLAKHPIFLINELHEVDAFDLHRVTHARNFREAGRTSLFRDDCMAADFCQRDYKWISLEFFLSRRHQAGICVHDAINLALYRFIWHKEHRLAWLEPCVKFFRALFAAFTQDQR